MRGIMSDTNTWKCSCGCKENTGTYCEECGRSKASQMAVWSCQCGHGGNTGAFCTKCGNPKNGIKQIENIAFSKNMNYRETAKKNNGWMIAAIIMIVICIAGGGLFVYQYLQNDKKDSKSGKKRKQAVEMVSADLKEVKPSETPRATPAATATPKPTATPASTPKRLFDGAGRFLQIFEQSGMGRTGYICA